MRRLVDSPELYGPDPAVQRRTEFRLVGRRRVAPPLQAKVVTPPRIESRSWSENLLTTIGVRLRARRKAVRRTQREIARRVGITQASLSNYERGKRDMTISTLVALAAVLGVNLSDLVMPG